MASKCCATSIRSSTRRKTARRRCSRRARRCSCRSGTSRCRPNRQPVWFRNIRIRQLDKWRMAICPIYLAARAVARHHRSRAIAGRARAGSGARRAGACGVDGFRAARHAQLSRAHASRRSRTIRCCARCCRWPMSSRDAGIRLRSAGGTRGHARAQPAAEIRRPRAAHHHPGLRHPLPLLFPARISVFRAAEARRGRAAAGARRSSAIANDTSIEEVILSGGDPLSLSDARLDAHHRRDRRHAARAAHPRAHAPAHRAAVARR